MVHVQLMEIGKLIRFNQICMHAIVLVTGGPRGNHGDLPRFFVSRICLTGKQIGKQSCGHLSLLLIGFVMSCICFLMFIFYHLTCVQDMNSSVGLFLMAFSSDHAMQNKSSEMPPP